MPISREPEKIYRHQYNVFLSHHSGDKPQVEIISGRLLREYGLKSFLDKERLIPGERWIEALEQALDESATCAVFLGPHGLGDWQNEEMRAAIDRSVKDSSFRVIPVLLPGADHKDKKLLPSFLSRLTWVDFRLGVNDADALDRLVAGIRGKEPAEIRISRTTRLSEEALTGLSQFLNDYPVGGESLSRIFARSLPPTAAAGERSALLSGYASYAGYASYDGFLRLFDYNANCAWRYLNLLIEEIGSEPGADKLRQWIAVNAPLAGVDLASLNLRQDAIPDAIQSDERYLLIRIDPSRYKRNHYQVSAWGKTPGRPDFPYLDDNEPPTSVRRLGEIVERLVKQARIDFGTSEIVIELILPRQLFTLDLALWKFRLYVDLHLLEHHPVVLRWLERLNDRNLHPQWNDKWRALQRDPQAGRRPRLHWIESADCRTAAATMNSLAAAEHGVCTVLGFTLPEKYDEKSDLLTAALAAGSPVALWLRETPQNLPLTAEAFESLLETVKLDALPRRVWEWRRQPCDEHFGHQLVLLYDDPDRKPPRSNLQAP